MDQKEILKDRIEEERRKLDHLVERKAAREVTYQQSLVVDQLIEQYLEL